MNAQGIRINDIMVSVWTANTYGGTLNIHNFATLTEAVEFTRTNGGKLSFNVR